MESNLLLLKNKIYLFIERGEGTGKGRERNISVWLPFVCPLLGTWPATQARALTGNQTGHPLAHRRALNPLSHPARANLLLLYFMVFVPRKHLPKPRLPILSPVL